MGSVAAMPGSRRNNRVLRDAIIAKLRARPGITAYDLHGSGLQRLGSLAAVKRILCELLASEVATHVHCAARGRESTWALAAERLRA